MNAFELASRVEAEGVGRIVEFLREQSDRGHFVLTAKGRLARDLQLRVGDAMVNRDGDIFGVEFKIERADKHGNFFLETWSNRSRFNRGWLDHLDTDVLLYFFMEDGKLYSIPFQRLKKWAFGDSQRDGRIYDFPERKQSKYRQMNDTWGRCVPIKVVIQEVRGVRTYETSEDGESWTDGSR